MGASVLCFGGLLHSGHDRSVLRACTSGELCWATLVCTVTQPVARTLPKFIASFLLGCISSALLPSRILHQLRFHQQLIDYAASWTDRLLPCGYGLRGKATCYVLLVHPAVCAVCLVDDALQLYFRSSSSRTDSLCMQPQNG